MDIRKRKELVYRCIQISAWANNFPPKNQTQRELLVAIHKLNRLWWIDEVHYLSTNSVKRSKKLGHRKSKEIGLQYERIVQLVGKALNDTANASGKMLSSAELHEQMYGQKGLLTRAVEYGRLHAAMN